MGTVIVGLGALDARTTKLELPPKHAERAGLLLMPPILPLKEWEALAVPQQDTLARLTHVDEARS